jgi:hypothetical protein
VQVFGRRNDGLTTRCGERRPKSAKARNRVGRLCGAGAAGWRRCRGYYGDLEVRLSRIMPRGEDGFSRFALR